MKQQVHTNSIKAYHSEKGNIDTRTHIILGLFMDNWHRGFTDREVQHELGYAERGDVQPRCSDLRAIGAIKRVGNRKCAITKKTVSVCQYQGGQLKQSMLFNE